MRSSYIISLFAIFKDVYTRPAVVFLLCPSVLHVVFRIIPEDNKKSHGNRTWGIAYILENTKMNKAKIEGKLEGFVDI